MAAAHLNWAGAKVKDGRLAVELQGEVPSGWKKSFQNTVRLLGAGEWGPVEVQKRTVRVSGLVPGVEEKLRHFLESVVEQANAAHPPKESEADEPEQQAGDDDEGPDAVMTERFRSFSAKERR